MVAAGLFVVLFSVCLIGAIVSFARWGSTGRVTGPLARTVDRDRPLTGNGNTYIWTDLHQR